MERSRRHLDFCKSILFFVSKCMKNWKWSGAILCNWCGTFFYSFNRHFCFDQKPLLFVFHFQFCEGKRIFLTEFCDFQSKVEEKHILPNTTGMGTKKNAWEQPHFVLSNGWTHGMEILTKIIKMLKCKKENWKHYSTEWVFILLIKSEIRENEAKHVKWKSLNDFSLSRRLLVREKTKGLAFR